MSAFPRIENDKYSGQFPEPLPESPKMDPGVALPCEIFQKTLSYLNPQDCQRTSAVCRDWNAATVDMARMREFNQIREFVDCLVVNLSDSDSEHKMALMKAIEESAILYSGNLRQIKSSTNDLNKKILQILATLDRKTLQVLQKAAKEEKKLPQFFECLTDVIRIYKRLDRALKLDATHFITEHRQGHELSDISIELAQIGCFAKAIVVTGMATPKYRIMCLKFLSEALTKLALMQDVGNVNKILEILNRAILVANLIPADAFGIEEEKDAAMEGRSCALYDAAIALAEKGHPDKAIEVASTILHSYLKTQALDKISKVIPEVE